MMATTPESYRAATASSPYTRVAAHEHRRQMSTPAALAATFTSCGFRGGGRGWPRNRVDDDDDGGGGDGELRGRAPRPAAAGGDVGAVVRALWAWVARSRKAVMSRSGSSVKEQYWHEEYAQNFDDGGAAVEPENLSRSFSARYARQAPWDVDGARQRG